VVVGVGVDFGTTLVAGAAFWPGAGV